MEYIRKVHYYETDQMGVVHHSNYIKYFEEARIDFFKKTKLSYDEIEKMGVIVPVLEVECKFKNSCTFNDTIIIHTKLISFNGIKFAYEYKITNENNDKILAVGKSLHCFVDKNFKPVMVKKTHPVIYNYMLEAVENKE